MVKGGGEQVGKMRAYGPMEAEMGQMCGGRGGGGNKKKLVFSIAHQHFVYL